jgi:hypothetical protein
LNFVPSTLLTYCERVFWQQQNVENFHQKQEKI